MSFPYSSLPISGGHTSSDQVLSSSDLAQVISSSGPNSNDPSGEKTSRSTASSVFSTEDTDRVQSRWSSGIISLASKARKTWSSMASWVDHHMLNRPSVETKDYKKLHGKFTMPGYRVASTTKPYETYLNDTSRDHLRYAFKHDKKYGSHWEGNEVHESVKDLLSERLVENLPDRLRGIDASDGHLTYTSFTSKITDDYISLDCFVTYDRDDREKWQVNVKRSEIGKGL